MYKRPGRRVWYASLSDVEKHISLGTEDDAEARAEFAKLLERRRVRDLAPNEEALSKIFEMTQERADTNNTPKTAYGLGRDLLRILRWLEGRGVYSARKIDLALVEDYKTARRFEKVTAARINRELDSWKRAMKVAVETGNAPKHALESFVKLREPRPEPHQRGLTKTELKRFLAAADKRYRSLFRLALGSGLRDDEIRHLEKDDVRGDHLVVTPKPGWTTKGYRYRRVWISKATAKAAKEYLAARDAGLNLDQKRVWKIIQAACDEAQIPAFSMHDLRRAWASHLMESGTFSLKAISQMLGHAEVATTERYLQIVETQAPKPGSLPW